MKSLFSYSKLAVASIALLGASIFSSCKTDPIAPNAPLQFAALRVLNYTQSDSVAGVTIAPVDVYFSPANGQADTLAQVNNLQFGQASVYTNTLQADPNGTAYHIKVTRVRNPDQKLTEEDIVLKAGHRYSYVVYNDPSNLQGRFYGKLVEDGIQPANTDPSKQTFVRFMNVYPGQTSGQKLTATVNSPTGDKIAPAAGLGFTETGDYVALNTAMDTTYAFYVIDAANPSNVLGKISYQSFAPGSYHTILYAGDLYRTGSHASEMGDATDSLRVRVLDDNVLGNEETSPIPQSIRYFIVNAMIPDEAPGSEPFWAYTVANDANPAHFGFTFDPVRTFDPVPNYGAIDGNGIQNVYYSATTLSTWIDVKGFQVADAHGASQKIIFDVHAPRKDMVSDNAYAMIFFDTIPPAKKSDSSGLARTMITVPMPEPPSQDSAVVVFANAVAPSGVYKSVGTGASGNITSIYINGTDKVPFGGTNGSRITVSYPANQDLNITAKLGTSSTLVDVSNSVTLHTEPGGVYLVTIIGQRSDDKFHSDWPARIKVFRVGH